MNPLDSSSFPGDDAFAVEHISSIAGDYLEGLNRPQLLALIRAIAVYQFPVEPLPEGLIYQIQLLSPEGALVLMAAALCKARFGHTD